MSECLYAGKTLVEVAGYTDWQLSYVLCRRRDKAGRLDRSPREELPPWVEVDDDGMRVIRNPVPLGVAFKQVQRRRGRTDEQAVAAWQRWLDDNPKFGKSIL